MVDYVTNKGQTPIILISTILVREYLVNHSHIIVNTTLVDSDSKNHIIPTQIEIMF